MNQVKSKMALLKELSAPMITVTNNVAVRFETGQGMIVARLLDPTKPKAALQALCSMSKAYMDAQNAFIDKGLDVGQSLEYRKLKAIARLAAYIWNSNKQLSPKWKERTLFDYLTLWSEFHGKKRRDNPTAGHYSTFPVVMAGKKVKVTYRPAFYDTLDQFIFNYSDGVGAVEGSQSKLVRRAEVRRLGGVIECAQDILSDMKLVTTQPVLQLPAPKSNSPTVAARLAGAR